MTSVIAKDLSPVFLWFHTGLFSISDKLTHLGLAWVNLGWGLWEMYFVAKANHLEWVKLAASSLWQACTFRTNLQVCALQVCGRFFWKPHTLVGYLQYCRVFLKPIRLPFFIYLSTYYICLSIYLSIYIYTGWPPKKANSRFFKTLLWSTVFLFHLAG